VPENKKSLAGASCHTNVPSTDV